MNGYNFNKPEDVLKESISMKYVFERYRINGNKIDFLKFMDDIFSVESSSSYYNAFQTVKLDYYAPYAKLKMSKPLDLNKIRNGEPKYLICELFSKNIQMYLYQIKFLCQDLLTITLKIGLVQNEQSLKIT